jgi:hypothetical protein
VEQLLVPNLLAGSIVGVLFNAVSPEWLLTILLVIALGWSGYTASKKAWTLYAEEARTAHLTADDPQALWRALDDSPESLFARSMAFFGAGEDFNSRRWRGAVIGSGSGHATARAIACLYGQFVWPGLLSAGRRRALCSQRAANPASAAASSANRP